MKGKIRKIRRNLHKHVQHKMHKRFLACQNTMCDAVQNVRSDISDHLPTLFATSVKKNAKCIVELGTRGGESTQAFISASKLTSAHVLSIDINPCPNEKSYKKLHPKWQFYQSDDIAFSRGFDGILAEKQLPHIDTLFIDSSHEYQHTKDEIKAYFPYLGPRSVVILHDTNLSEIGQHKDGQLSLGWNNQRGVIRAVEDFFGTSFDEKTPFIKHLPEWLIEHVPYSHGLTILSKIPKL